VVRKGAAAPGTAAGVNFSGVGGLITFNSAGQVAFTGSLTGSGVTSANNSGIWVSAAGGVALLARSGDPAPGTAAGVSYVLFSSPVINSTGRVAFSATARAGTSGTAPRGVWVGTPGNVALLARVGNAAPSTPAGVTFSVINSSPRLNAAGQTLFQGILSGSGVTASNDSGIWKGVPGAVAKVYREGDPAPGAGAGTLFGEAFNGGESINDRGEVVFVNELTGPNVTTANDRSIWFVDAAGNFTLVAREGDAFAVARDDSRVLSFFTTRSGSGDEAGSFSGFNDRGQIAFHATFTDGSSGIFVASPLVGVSTVTKAGDTFSLAVPALSGNTYQLQRAISLGDEFVDIGSPQQGSSGSQLTFLDPQTPVGQAFYRVEIRP
jgi:hypothetical protein